MSVSGCGALGDPVNTANETEVVGNSNTVVDEFDELFLTDIRQTEDFVSSYDSVKQNSIVKNVSARDHSPSKEDVSEKREDTSLSSSDKCISPIHWDRSGEPDPIQDAVHVDAPENEFSKEADEQSQSESVKPESSKEAECIGNSFETMDPDILTDFDQLFINTKYFLIKSNNFDNVEIAKRKNAWATPIGNEGRLNRAYFDSNNVILVFSVRESGKFQGFARLASSSDPRLHIDWILPPRMSPDMLSSPFKLDWITKQELPFNNVAHLTNAWNEGKPVKIGRDGQEIEPVCGQALCRHFTLDSVESIPAIVRKIEPKKLKSNDSTRRRNAFDRLGTSQPHSSSSRRSRELGFNNPSSVGLLGAATTSSSSNVPLLMHHVNPTSAAMATVAAMAAIKSNQSRGALLPGADLSRLINPNSTLVPHLLSQAASTNPISLSAFYNNHGSALNRNLRQNKIPTRKRHGRSRSKSFTSRSSSGGRRSNDSDCHHRSRRERHRDYRQSAEPYRYRTRSGGLDDGDDSLMMTAIYYVFFPDIGLLLLFLLLRFNVAQRKEQVHTFKSVLDIVNISNSMKNHRSCRQYATCKTLVASICTFTIVLDCFPLSLTFFFQVMDVMFYSKYCSTNAYVTMLVTCDVLIRAH
uniref:YTH domain-containing protein n=1 Tax=Mesocestoides corti TaxID=53468 RepID=A0A5K3EFX8_MESCO